MASLRVLRRRIRSTQNTKQIMRAMQMVSGSKLKRAQQRLLQARETMGFLDGLLARVLSATPSLTHPLCAASSASSDALALFTSDAGLCGAYNTNLIHLAESHLRRDRAQSPQMIYVGKKGARHFTTRGYPALEAFLDLAGRPNLETIDAIGRALMARFLSGDVSAVTLLYARFVSAMTSRPVAEPWLPIQLRGDRGQGTGDTSRDVVSHVPRPTSHAAALEYIFEPSVQRVFDDLLPRWALAKFQLVTLEAFTSEHSARMLAMKNATDNAGQLIDEMTLQRNKIRQATITKELSEIVGTVEALK